MKADLIKYKIFPIFFGIKVDVCIRFNVGSTLINFSSQLSTDTV